MFVLTLHEVWSSTAGTFSTVRAVQQYPLEAQSIFITSQLCHRQTPVRDTLAVEEYFAFFASQIIMMMHAKNYASTFRLVKDMYKILMFSFSL